MMAAVGRLPHLFMFTRLVRMAEKLLKCSHGGACMQLGQEQALCLQLG